MICVHRNAFKCLPTETRLNGLQEEASQAGLQRQLWWDIELPGQPDVAAKFSPVFNAIWVASDAARLREPEGDGMRNASADGHELVRARSSCHLCLHLCIYGLVLDVCLLMCCCAVFVA